MRPSRMTALLVLLATLPAWAHPPTATDTPSEPVDHTLTWILGGTATGLLLTGGALVTAAYVSDLNLGEQLNDTRNGVIVGVTYASALETSERNGRINTAGFVLLGVGAGLGIAALAVLAVRMAPTHHESEVEVIPVVTITPNLTTVSAILRF
ncbi:MAG: hypothetical protein ACI9OJ_005169 [Myxococcota bacterium]|jgi:hypothetical protein